MILLPEQRGEAERLLARLMESAGLERAWSLFPADVAAACARGNRPMARLPDGWSPLVEPAFSFDPGIGARDK